jgi:hypothetical protein
MKKKTFITLEKRNGKKLYQQLVDEFINLGIYDDKQKAIIYDEDDKELTAKIKEILDKYSDGI